MRNIGSIFEKRGKKINKKRFPKKSEKLNKNEKK